MRPRPYLKGSLRILLVGYNGANNTGAEALLLRDIADFLHVFGSKVTLTIPTLNEENLRRYVSEGSSIRIVPVSPVFVRPVRQLVAQHDVVALVEGSTFMDTWTSALLWYFLWAARCAHSRHIPCLAYSVDAGTLRPVNRRLVRRVASDTDLIIVRSEAAAQRLRAWGVTAPIEATADNAFTFTPRREDHGILERAWQGSRRPVVGIAPVDFTLWPVVVRLWGRRQRCYRWPYYFSHSQARQAVASSMADTLAAFADSLVEEFDASIAMLCMEELDEPMVERIVTRMRHPRAAMTFSARRYDASQMTALLRSLDYLVTSRFHASVLSLQAHVPQLAIGHDLRLSTLFTDLGIRDECFLDHASLNIETLAARMADLQRRELEFRERLSVGYEAHAARARVNRTLLQRFAGEIGVPSAE